MNWRTVTDLYNVFETALWTAAAIAACVLAVKTPPSRRRYIIIAAIILFFGALSEAIEVKTGAWWRPWPLAALKITCITTFILNALAYRRTLTQEKQDPDPSRLTNGDD